MDLDYEGLFTALNRAGIDYIIAGGLAVNLHGLPRMTFDVDLLILLEPDNVLRLVELLVGLGYRPRLPVAAEALADEAMREQWRREKGLLAFTFQHATQPLAEVDILLDAPAPYQELKTRTLSLPFGATAIPVLSRQDLITMKRGSPRTQDACDADFLEKLSGQ